MAKEQKTNLYLLSIVAIVAIVGIVVLILNSGAGSVSLSSDDLSGEAVKALKSGSSSLTITSTQVDSSGATLGVSEGCVTTCCQRLSNGCAKYCTECS